MKRYLNLYLTFIKINWSLLLMYRFSFFNSAFSNVLWGMLLISGAFFLTNKTPAVFGWRREDFILFAAIYNVVFGIVYFFFAKNFREVSRIIHYGELDTLLLKPVDSQFFLSFRFVYYSNLLRVIFGLLVILFILHQLHISLTLITIFGFFMLVFLGVATSYSLSFIVLTLTIWFTNLSNLHDLLSTINSVTRFPQEMYRGGGEYLFIMLFPLTFVVISPAKALLNRILLGDVIWPLIFAVTLVMFSRFFWKFALRFYTSASG